MQACKQEAGARLRTLSIALALFAAQAAFSLAQAQTTYSITPLGSLGGGQAAANALNNVGDIVGCSLRVINGETVSRAFVYRNGQLTDIGALTADGASCANDINDSGVVTGNSTAATGERRAFVYQNGTISSLGNLGSSTDAASINNNGQIAGSANDFNGKYIGAFRYDVQTQQVIDLGSLGNGIITSSNSINATGDVVGFAVNAQSRGTTFLFSNGAISDLGNVLGFPNAVGGINDLGQVVGSRSEGGYLYAAGAVTTLPTLAGNGSVPKAVNNSTQIVGQAWTETGNHAFVITQGQIVDLNDAIDASSPDKAFVTLEVATDINDNGWIIADGLDVRTFRRGPYLLRPITTQR
jgi:probable HAF family extracellular repeat protein